MFKSMKSIILLIVVLIITLGIFYFIPLSQMKNLGENTKYYKDVYISKVDDEYLQVTENIVAEISKTNIRNLYLPLSIYKDYRYDVVDRKVTINTKEILLKSESQSFIGKEILLNGQNFNSNYFDSIDKNVVYSTVLDRITISRLDNAAFETGKNYITISYKCRISDFVTNYNNLSTLNIRRNTKYDILNIIIMLPKTTSIFDVNSNKSKIEQVTNTIYKIDISNVKRAYYKENFEDNYSVEVVFDNNILNGAKRTYTTFNLTDKNNIFATEYEEHTIYFYVILTITILLSVITIIITKKVKVEKTYVRDTNNVISPILAESLIDRKMGSKELIMTCIVDLIHRGNIKNVDNDNFELMSVDNLLDYEEQLVNLIFNGRKIISLNEINDMFKKNNLRTKFFAMDFKQIKKKILDRLFELELYSKRGEKVLGYIRKLNILVYVNVFILARDIIYGDVSLLVVIIGLNIVAYLIIILCGYWKKQNRESYRKTGKGFSLAWSLSMELVLIITSLIFVFKDHYMILIMLSILTVLNTIVLFKSKLHILTKKGKEEYKKIYGLKSYIVDFSLMEERDVDSTIIWDDYLTYAVAFSIPNKITNKFNSVLMESNIILQKIDRFITS